MAHDPHHPRDCSGGVSVLVAIEPSKYHPRDVEHPRLLTNNIRSTESPMPTAPETLALLTAQEGAEALAVEPGSYYVAYEQNRENVQHPADSEPSREQQQTDD
jgi:hypothetical protein